MSQDAVFWEIGQSENGKKALINPQSQNSYSYAGNNPVTYSDPDGKFVPALIAAIGALAMYAPQITSFAQSLMTPLGQYSLSEAGQDAQKGNYGMAAIGLMTLGEGSSGGKVAKGLIIGQDFGKLGKVAENVAGKINSLDPHVLMRMEQRGVERSLMDKVVSSPLVTFKQVNDRTLYLTREAAVVLDNAGKAITTYTKNEFKPHILKVLKSIKK